MHLQGERLLQDIDIFSLFECGITGSNFPLNLKDPIPWHNIESKHLIFVSWATVRMVPYQASVWCPEQNEGTVLTDTSCCTQAFSIPIFL